MTQPASPGSVIVLIRTSLRADADVAAYERLSARMDELVRTIPGFVDAKGYKGDDGEELSFVRFESLEALRAWREHPEHLVAQREGQTRFYGTYDVRICTVERAYSFNTDSGRLVGVQEERA